MPRLVPADFRLHSLYGVGVDWPLVYDDLEPWYGEAERALGVAGDHHALDGLHGARRSRPFPMSRIWPSYGDLVVERAAAGLQVHGIPVALTSTPQARNSRPYDGRPACAGNSSCVPLCPIGAKYDGSVHVRKAVAAGAVLWDRTVVNRLDLDRTTRRVRALRYTRWDEACERREGSLAADIYVVAAHAIETPRRLLASQDLDIAPAGVANGSDQVGRNLMDHLQGQGAALVAEPLYPFRGPPTTVGIDSFRDGAFRTDYAAFRLSIGNDGMGRSETPYAALDRLVDDGLIGMELRTALRDRLSRQFRISYSTEMLPRPGNRVTLAGGPADTFGMPPVMLAMALDDYSTQAFSKALVVVSAVFDRLGAPHHERVMQPRGTYFSAGHIMGTTRIGSDPRASVVDRACRAHDHDNLFIVGAGAFPTGGTANPTLTVAALALRAAQTVSSLLRTGP